MNRFDPPGGRPWGLFGLAGASLLLNVVLGTRLFLFPPTSVVEEMPVVVAPSVPVEQVAAVEAIADEAPVVEEVLEPVRSRPAGVQVGNFEVHHSLARTFRDGVGEDGKFVSAVFARLFAFDLDLRRDLQKGDRVAVAWEGEGKDIEVVAARYESRKKGTLTAYRFHVEGERYPRWLDAEGRDVSRELKNSPIVGYEQITSLLLDRPNHRGMDFKADEGIPVLSGAKGVVTRTDWNTHANGNCVEVKYHDGTVAKYLHLSKTGVKAGQRVAVGEALGLVGNTGRSTAAHLHYELAKNKKVIDPIDYHGVTRFSLPAGQRAAFEARVVELEGWLLADQS